MALEELAGWLDDGLVLPIDGKKYKIPEYSAEVGLRVEALLNVGSGNGAERHRQVLSDEAEKDLFRDVLGPVYEPLLKAVSWPMVKHCALTAMYHFNISEQIAEAHWKTRSPQPGKAIAGRSSRPATQRTTAAATTTRARASTSGTRSRKSS